MKVFNTTGVCIPSKHYMVDLTERVRQIRKMVDAGEYFTINRARQYGKTTTLHALAKYLKRDYVVIRLDFQSYGADTFENQDSFCRDFSVGFCEAIEAVLPDMDPETENLLDTLMERAENEGKSFRLFHLFRFLKKLCASSPKPVVLMIDEVDSATNNQVFLDFLAQLREGFLSRAADGAPAFHSVILAGVTDVRSMKRKIRPEEEHKVNSPWNIATAFEIDMSLSAEGIAGMLDEYEKDHGTGMDTAQIAREIYNFTGGYPFLVSRICQLIDTQLAGEERFPDRSSAWTVEGVSEAVRRILNEKNTLFDSLMGKIQNDLELMETVQQILFEGDSILYNSYQINISDAEMYGFIRNEHGKILIANRIFETLLYNYYLSERKSEYTKLSGKGEAFQDDVIQDGRLLMDRVLERYVTVFNDLYGDQEEIFDEAEGRRRFLLYLRPIINGTGNYYIEAETRNRERMDLVVDYLGERHVVELKIWRGQAYHEKGERQLAEYLDSYHLNKGYLLTYNFNQKKESGITEVTVDGKTLIEVMV